MVSLKFVYVYYVCVRACVCVHWEKSFNMATNTAVAIVCHKDLMKFFHFAVLVSYP